MKPWLAFYPDYTIKEFEEPNENVRCLFWVKVVDTGRRCTTSYGNTYAVNKYEFLDKKLNSMQYNKGGWVLSEISDNYFKNAFTDLHIKVKDPIGQIKPYKVKYGEEGIIQAVEMVDRFSHFDNWQNYDLAEKNKTLKEELEKANGQIDELKLLIETFKNTDFFKRIINEIELAKEGGNELEKDNVLAHNELSSDFFEHWLK